jgi:uncharacterized membrane protein
MKESKHFFAKNNRLNKGYFRAGHRESDNNFQRKKFDHVLPPVDLIEQYEDIHPGTLAKLMIMAEKEQRHRHQLDIKNIKIYENATKKGRLTAIIFMFIMSITVLILTILGHFMASVIFTISVFLIIGIGLVCSSSKFVRKE